MNLDGLELRVGQGFDVHRFGDDPARPLVLGGCVFPDLPGLTGHSDGDVIAHAVAEALLGAAGLGDIGQRFPDSDPAYAGADSIELLRMVATDVRAAGWAVGNVDCSVICEAPRLAPLRADMEARLSAGRRRAGDGEGAAGRGPRCARPVGGHRLLRRGDPHAGHTVSEQSERTVDRAAARPPGGDGVRRRSPRVCS